MKFDRHKKNEDRGNKGAVLVYRREGRALLVP